MIKGDKKQLERAKLKLEALEYEYALLQNLLLYNQLTLAHQRKIERRLNQLSSLRIKYLKIEMWNTDQLMGRS